MKSLRPQTEKAVSAGDARASRVLGLKARRMALYLAVLALVSGVLGSGLYTTLYRLDAIEARRQRMIRLVTTLKQLDVALDLALQGVVSRRSPQWEQRCKDLEAELEGTLRRAVDAGIGVTAPGLADRTIRAAWRLGSVRGEILESVAKGSTDRAADLVRGKAYDEAEHDYRKAVSDYAYHVSRELEKQRDRYRTRLVALSVGGGASVFLVAVFLWARLWRIGRGVERFAVSAAEEHEEKRFLRSLIESIPHPFCVIDPRDFRLEMANQATQRTLPTEGATCYAVIHGLNAPCAGKDRPCPVHDVMTTKSPKTVTHVLEGPAGQVRYLRVHAYPVLDRTGEVAKVIEHLDEITDQVRAEQRLRESEERFRCITAQARDAIIMIDGQGDISFWNEAAERMFGYLAEEVVGKNLHRLLAPERFHGAHLAAFEGFRETGHGNEVGKTLELTAVRKGGEEFPIELSLSAVQVRGAWHGIGIVRDITARKRSEEALEQAKQAAERNAEIRSQFLANMSHEIRTPLNGIIGMTELALQTDLTDEQREYLEAVKASSDHLLGVLNEILDLSKIEAGRLELEEVNFDLWSTMEFVVEQLAVKAHQKGLELLCDIRPGVPRFVTGDPGRLRQILLNLGNNAIKFTEKGWIKVACELEARQEDSVRVHFQVSDTGIGIPEEKREMIFEVFRQADGSMTRRFGGTGLGLAISKSLSERMGGEIWVEGRKEGGSTFHVTVRLGLRAHVEPSDLERLHDNLRGMRVLIVDPNPDSRAILAEMLGRWGLCPDEAGGAEEALEQVARAAVRGSPFQVLLVDEGIDGPAGPSLRERIHRTGGQERVRLFLLASRWGESSRVDGLGRSYDARLFKPVKQSVLFDLLVRVAAFEEPRKDAAPGGEVGMEAEVGMASRQRLRILLAEDNEINQKVVVKMLEKLGHAVTVACHGREAVDLVARAGEAIDLVLMDGQMPVMDGLEATRLIREQERAAGRHIPIIAMTAHAMEGDRERFLSAGMDDYIPKPIRPDRLAEVLERWGQPAVPSRGNTNQDEAEETSPKGEKTEASTPLDLEGALERAGGDKAFLAEMLEHFVGSLPGEIEHLRSALGIEDAEALAKQAHTLKGAAATLGAARIASIALEIEEVAKAGEVSRGSELLEALAEEASRLAAYLNDPQWKEAA